MKTEYRIHIRFAGMMLGLAALQIALGPLITIGDILPSFVLIGVLFITQLQGRLAGMLHGFPSGILVDLYAGEVAGLTSLALLLAAFVTGHFHDEERSDAIIRGVRMPLIIILGALLFYMVYVFAYFRSLEFDILQLALLHIGGGTLYTSILGCIPVLILAGMQRKIGIH